MAKTLASVSKSEQYESGFNNGMKMFDGDFSRIVGSIQAAKEWKAALSDPGHTSYWGVAHIQKMRAYWLGEIRGWRAAAFAAMGK